jgi:hypothetical protein
MDAFTSSQQQQQHHHPQPTQQQPRAFQSLEMGVNFEMNDVFFPLTSQVEANQSFTALIEKNKVNLW